MRYLRRKCKDTDVVWSVCYMVRPERVNTSLYTVRASPDDKCCFVVKGEQDNRRVGFHLYLLVSLVRYETEDFRHDMSFDIPAFLEPYLIKGNGQKNVSAPSDGQFFYDDEGIDTAYKSQYNVQSSEDAGIDDDDKDDDLLVDEENNIVETDVDMHLFGISMDVPFDNIGVTNLVSNDFLEGGDVDVINADGFDSDPGHDDETSNYTRRRLAELSREMEGVINASGHGKGYATWDGGNSTWGGQVKGFGTVHVCACTGEAGEEGVVLAGKEVEVYCLGIYRQE
nr:hypothetical protein [Tanacetum cinerariifolium]